MWRWAKGEDCGSEENVGFAKEHGTHHTACRIFEIMSIRNLLNRIVRFWETKRFEKGGREEDTTYTSSCVK